MKIKQIIFSLLISLALSPVAIGQKAYAASIAPTDDVSVLYSSTSNPSDNGDFLYTDSVLGNKNVTFLKFVTDELQGVLNGSENLTSLTLKLFYEEHDKNSGLLPSLYFITNDNWNEIDGFMSADMNIGSLFVGSAVVNETDSSMTFDLLAATQNFINTNPSELTDGFASFAIKYDTTDEDQTPNTIFRSEEFDNGNFSPEINIGTTPAPEPSSIVFGLLGLSSALGLRRRK